MEWFFMLLYVLLGLFFGLVLGAGNRAGFRGAVAAGLIGGIVLCIPFWDQLAWYHIAIYAGLTTIGSIWCNSWPTTHWFKRFWRSPLLGHLSIGVWEIGSSSKNS